MIDEKDILRSFSRHLFWDVNIDDIDIKTNSRFIIGKVLNYGLYSDWKNLLRLYNLEEVVENALTIKDLDKRTVSFLSAISGVPKNKFICYTTGQSTPGHWNF